ncbi:MAG: hypothetical protein LLG04_15720 [Parachlamydia sp.]|nr:hypothetical protein [Parachlamydia sp.]
MLFIASSLPTFAESPRYQTKANATKGSQGKLPPRMYAIQSFITENGLFSDLAFKTLRISKDPTITTKVQRLLATLKTAFPDHPEHLEAFFSENLPPIALAEILGKALLSTSQSLEENQFLLKATLKHFPDVAKFMIQLDNKNQMTFSLEGYELLLAIMRQRKRLTVDCRICITEKEWKDSFEKFLSGPDKKASWIIRNADAKDRMDATIHYFPIYAEKGDGAVHIAITDSLGKEGFGHPYISLLINLLRGQKRAQIYIANEVRQYFSVGCPIYSLRDIIHLSKYPRVMKFLEDHSQRDDHYRESNVEIYEIKDLPPPLMKYTHELHKLGDYEDKINAPAMSEEEFPLVHMTVGESNCREQIPAMKFIKPLAAKGHIRIEKSEEGGGKVYNLTVRDRYLKYCAMVVAISVAFGKSLMPSS